MTKHRVFIAINLPEEIKKKLASYQEKIEELFTPHLFKKGGGPIRWTKKDNLHITLEFLGYVADNELLEICQNTKQLASKLRPFTVTLNKICYGPPKKIPPRMVWVEGEKSKEFTCLKESLEKALMSSTATHYLPENRVFAPHITLGRIKTWEFRQIEPEERPEVNEEINLNFKVNSIEIMESILKKGGPEYTILESIPFTQTKSEKGTEKGTHHF